MTKAQLLLRNLPFILSCEAARHTSANAPQVILQDMASMLP